ncbi:MAG: hypothetical protein WBE13_14320 [Candidatus Acidiferrum sp.]
MTKYQIAIFSNGGDSEAKILRQTLEARLTEIGIDLSLISFFDESTITSADPKAPTDQPEFLYHGE